MTRDKRKFDDVVDKQKDLATKPPKKKMKMSRKPNKNTIIKNIKPFVDKLNELYMELLMSIQDDVMYDRLENIYRNEEYDLIMLLKDYQTGESLLTEKSVGLNHTFKVLPLDKVSDEEYDLLLANLAVTEEYSDESDEDYVVEKEERKPNFFEKLFGFQDERKQHENLTKRIDNCKTLSDVEKAYMKTEYDKIKEIRKNNIPDKLKILKMKIPIEIKVELIEKIEMLENTTQDDIKIREWIKTVMKIPFGKYIDHPLKDNKNTKSINTFINDLHNSLDNEIYGQRKTKESLIEIITKWTTNNSTNGNCIALCGPKGTGKTSIVRGLSKILNRPFCSFSLAGVSDENYLTGFPYTYEGATCGRFAKMLMDSKCMNPIIFMDELDKVDTKRTMSVFNKLIEITDFSQNSDIEDHYLGSNIKLDLSKCIFIFSMNNERLIDPILRDRLEVINVDGFDNKDKLQIAKKFLIPREIEQYENKFFFPDEVIKYIINKTEKEQGVRNLKRNIEKVLRKINVLKYYNNKKLSYKIKNLDVTDKTLSIKIIDRLLKDDKKIDDVILRMYI